MPNPLDRTARLNVEVNGKVNQFAGLANIERLFKGAFDLQNTGLLKAQRLAQQTQKQYETSARAFEAAELRKQRAMQQSDSIALRLRQAQDKGNKDAAERYALQWEQAEQRRIAALQKSDQARTTMEQRYQQSQRASSLVPVARATAWTSTVLNGAGNALIGGTLGSLAVGGYLANQGMNWQTAAGQLYANTGINPGNLKQMQAFALKLATQSGGDPYAILTAVKIGMNAGLGLQGAEASTMAAIKSALPTGGDPIAVMRAIVTAQNAFQGFRGQPMNAIDVLHAVGQASNLDVGDLAANAAPALAVASLFGQSQFGQSLSAIGALTRQGFPVADAVTQVKDIYTQLERPATKNRLLAIQQIKAATGVDVSSDFTAQGIKQKGLAGILAQLHSLNLPPNLINGLVQNQRGGIGLGALLSPQGFGNFQSILNNANQGGGVTEKSYEFYQKLDSTKLEKIHRSLQAMEIDLGTKLLPSFEKLAKDLVPVAQEAAKLADAKPLQFVIENADKFLLAGLAIKGLATGYRALSDERVAAGLAKVGEKLGGIKLASTALAGGEAGGGSLAAVATSVGSIADDETKVNKLGGDLKLLKSAGTDALGTASTMSGGTIAAGTGIFGLATMLSFAVGLAASIPLVTHAAQSGHSFDWKDVLLTVGFPPGEIWNLLNNGGGKKSSSPASGARTSGGNSYHPWTAGYGNVPFPGSALGAGLGNPESSYQNRLVGLPGSGDRPGAQGFYQSLLGGHPGTYTDTDFPSKTGRPTDVVLPGGPNAKWTYVGPYIDPTGRGGVGEIWRDPMGHKDIFWHMGMDSRNGPLGSFAANNANPHGRMYWDQSSGQWHSLQPGHQYRGGTTVGQTGYAGGENHLCIVTDDQGRSDLVYLTTGQKASLQKAGYSVQDVGGSTTIGGVNVPGNVMNAISANASRDRIPGSALFGIWRQESGNGAYPNDFGYSGASLSNLGAQAAGAADTYAKWYNWTGSSAGRAALKAHGLNPDSPHDREMAALAIYNTGPNGPWWQSYYSNNSGSVTSGSASTATPFARGMAYATRTYNAGQGFPSGGSTGGQQYNWNPASLLTPAQLLTQDQANFSTIFGGINVAQNVQLTPAQKQLYVTFVQSIATHGMQAALQTIDQMTWMSPTQKRAAQAIVMQQASNQGNNAASMLAYQQRGARTSYAAQTLGIEWQGVNPSNLSGQRLHDWLNAQYGINEDNRDAADAQAWQDYYNGIITWDELQSRLKADNDLKNRLNQQARSAAGGGGAANHPVAVHVTGHHKTPLAHARIALPKGHHSITGHHPVTVHGPHVPHPPRPHHLANTAHSSEKTAGHTSKVAEHTKKSVDKLDLLHRDMQELITLFRQQHHPVQQGSAGLHSSGTRVPARPGR